VIDTGITTQGALAMTNFFTDNTKTRGAAARVIAEAMTDEAEEKIDVKIVSDGGSAKLILGEEIATLDDLAAFAQEFLFDDVVRFTNGNTAADYLKVANKHPRTVRLFADAKAVFGAAGVQVVGEVLDYVCTKHAADEAAYSAEIEAKKAGA
jgi:hypothetical protein